MLLFVQFDSHFEFLNNRGACHNAKQFFPVQAKICIQIGYENIRYKYFKNLKLFVFGSKYIWILFEWAFMDEFRSVPLLSYLP